MRWIWRRVQEWFQALPRLPAPGSCTRPCGIAGQKPSIPRVCSACSGATGPFLQGSDDPFSPPCLRLVRFAGYRGFASISPSATACMAASVRFVTPSLAKMRSTWPFTVVTEMPRIPEI